MVDVFNEIYTKLKTTLTTVNVVKAYPEKDAVFPIVVVSEISNTINLDCVDSSGEKASDISFEIGIYTNSTTRETDARKIRNSVDDVMNGYYKFNRESANPVPNYADRNVYRYVMRYSATINKNKVIYRR